MGMRKFKECLAIQICLNTIIAISSNVSILYPADFWNWKWLSHSMIISSTAKWLYRQNDIDQVDLKINNIFLRSIYWIRDFFSPQGKIPYVHSLFQYKRQSTTFIQCGFQRSKTAPFKWKTPRRGLNVPALSVTRFRADSSLSLSLPLPLPSLVTSCNQPLPTNMKRDDGTYKKSMLSEHRGLHRHSLFFKHLLDVLRSVI